jgi:hypothetical protein
MLVSMLDETRSACCQKLNPVGVRTSMGDVVAFRNRLVGDIETAFRMLNAARESQFCNRDAVIERCSNVAPPGLAVSGSD